MSKIMRLSGYNIQTKNSVVEYKLPTYESGAYLVDDSSFCPMSEAVKQLSRTAPISADEQQMYYDFPDGKDNGMKVPVQRMPNVSDITEISNSIMEDIHEIAEKQEKAARIAAQDAKFTAQLNAIKNNPSSSTPSSSSGTE